MNKKPKNTSLSNIKKDSSKVKEANNAASFMT
jgi:hypothetical protein